MKNRKWVAALALLGAGAAWIAASWPAPRPPRVPEDAAEAPVVIASSCIARRGDTLWQLAARHLGDARRWPDLAALNGIRDPRQLRAGDLVRLE